MRFELVFIGKTTDSYLQEGIENYKKKLMHYINVSTVIFPSSPSPLGAKGATALKTEAESILNHLNKTDYLIVLDEKGQNYSSIEFAQVLQKTMNLSLKKIVFLIGSAYGLHPSVRQRADLTVSFSRMTFTHQMIRILLMEQLYRAMTILKGEKYHHQ